MNFNGQPFSISISHTELETSVVKMFSLFTSNSDLTECPPVYLASLSQREGCFTTQIFYSAALMGVQ